MDLIGSFTISDSTKEIVTIVEEDDAAPSWLANVYEDDTISNQSSSSSHVANIEVTFGSKRCKLQSSNEHNEQVTIKITKLQGIDNDVEELNFIEKSKMQPDQMVSIHSKSLDEISLNNNEKEFAISQSKCDDQPNSRNENTKPEIQITNANCNVTTVITDLIVNEASTEKHIRFPRTKVTCRRKVKKFPGKLAAMKKQLTSDISILQDNNLTKNMNSTSAESINSNNMITSQRTLNYNRTEPIQNNDKEITASSRITGIIRTIAKNIVKILPSLHNYVSIKNLPKSPLNYVENAWKKVEYVKSYYFDLSYKLTVYLIEDLNYAPHFKKHLNYWVIESAREESVYYCASYFDVLVNDLLQWSEQKRNQEKGSPLHSVSETPTSITHPINHTVTNATVINSNHNMSQQNMSIPQLNSFQSYVSTIPQRHNSKQPTQSLVPPSYQMALQQIHLSSYQERDQYQEIRKHLLNHVNVESNVSNKTPQVNNQNIAMMPSTSQEERSLSRDSGFFSPNCDERVLEQVDPGSAPTTDSTVRDTPVISFVTSMNPEATMMPYGKCKMCGTITNLRCLGCNQSYYCNSNCQMADWPNHRIYCTNNKVR